MVRPMRCRWPRQWGTVRPHPGVLAGFAAPVAAQGSPRIFLSHGREDEVLPIKRCGRHLARALGQAGYDLDYREFAGGHVVPPDLVNAAFARFLGADEGSAR